MGEACSTHGDMRNAYTILVGKPARKRDLEDVSAERRIPNIKVYRKKTYGEGSGLVLYCSG